MSTSLFVYIYFKLFIYWLDDRTGVYRLDVEGVRCKNMMSSLNLSFIISSVLNAVGGSIVIASLSLIKLNRPCEYAHLAA